MLLTLAALGFAADPFFRWKDHTERDAWGTGYGISVADVDGDGWTDVAVPYSKRVWLNDAAAGWTLIAVPQLGNFFYYGASLGDFDLDGLPDWSTEPRGTATMLLHNEGGGAFATMPPEQFPNVGGQSTETNLWVDFDGNGYIDLFVPAYYGDSGLYMNLGPDKDGLWHFDEGAIAAGIVLSVTGAFRPEGAQNVDVDRDGDPDLYVCGELLRNESVPGAPWFVTDEEAGIIPAFDEGAAFADVDMDGDFDLAVLYHGQDWDASLPTYVMLLWRNNGDSTFTLMPEDTTEESDLSRGYNLGMSFTDWDHDGDPDITFSDRFEQNQWRESGEFRFSRIDTEAGQIDATPGWFDWDRDGDQDIALGVWGAESQFFQNALYDGVDAASRRYLRVRPLDPTVVFPDGLEVSYGATVEVAVAGEAAEVRRRAFLASGHGYLNQSEYTPTFGLEGLKAPVVDVTVDFSSAGLDGVWRIDRHINPALEAIDVLALADHEIDVLRDGRVFVDGVESLPTADEDPLLQTPGGLWIPTVDDTLEPSPGAWVGLEVVVPDDGDPTYGAAIREVIVDGLLGEPATCGEHAGNVLIFDAADGSLVGGATGATGPENRRADVPTDVIVHPGHTYRVVARVDQRRGFTPGESDTRLTVAGGFTVTAVDDPCDPSWVLEAPVEVEGSLHVRYRDRVVEPPVPDTEETGEIDTEETGETETEETDSETETEPPTTESESETESETTDGRDTGAPEAKGGCGCDATGPTGAAGALLAAGLIGLRRRRG